MATVMTGETAAATERWFRRRGVPHFTQDYSAREDILTRALPFLILVLVLEAFLFNDPNLPLWVNALTVVAVLALLAAAWAGLNLLRRRRPLALPQRVGIVEVLVFVFLPGLLAGVLSWNWVNFPPLAVFNVFILAVVFVIVSYGIVPIAIWALRMLVVRLGEVVGLFARALPLLLLVVTFLYINAEVWRIAAFIDLELLVAIVVLFGGITSVFLASRLPAEIRDLEEFHSAERVRELARGTPVEGVNLMDGMLSLDIPLRRRQWLNSGLVVLVSLALQVVFVSALLGLFFTVFGVIVVNESVVLEWVGRESEVLLRFGDQPESLALTVAHLKVATLLSTFAAFYFTVSMVTNPEYRAEFFEDIVADLRQALAVRALYLSAIEQGEAEAAAEG